jgi:hypothetical protein
MVLVASKVRYRSNLSEARHHGERPESLRVFGRLPDKDARECTEAGVRKASKEETAGGVRTDAGVGLCGICRRCLI